MLKLKWNIYITLAIVFAGIANSARANQHEIVSGNQEIFRDYYSLLKNSANEPPDIQTDSLKSFIQAHPSFERPWHQLLTLYLQNNQRDEAERYFKTCARQSHQQRNSIWALSTLAAARDSNDVAFNLLKKALRIEKPTPYLLMEFTDYFNVNTEKSAFENELDKMQFSPMDQNIALVFYYSNLQDVANCRHYLEQVKDDDQFKLYAQHIDAFIHQSQSKYDASRLLFQDGLAESKKHGDEQFYIHNLISIARLHLEFGRTKKAMGYCQDAFDRAQKFHDLDRMLAVYITFGAIHQYQKEYLKALESLQRAQDIASAQNHTRALANIYLKKGDANLRLSRHAKALEMYNVSVQYAKSSRDSQGVLSAIRNKGELYMELNLYDLANHEFVQAMQLADSSANQRHYNTTHIDWAANLYETNAFEQSRELLARVIESGHLGVTSLLYAYFHLATCYEIEENYNAALDTYAKVCKIVDENFANKNTHYYKALALPQMAAIETSFGHYSRAKSFLDEQIIKDIMKNSTNLSLDYYSSIALLYFHQKDFDKAINNYLRAVKFLENNREKMEVEHFRIGYFQKTSDVYQKLTTSFYERYREQKNKADLENIFVTLQKCSGRTMQDFATLKKNVGYSEDYCAAIDSLQNLQRRLRDSVWKKESAMTAELHAQHDIARHALLSQRGLILDQASSLTQKQVSLGELKRVCGANDLDVLFYYISDSLSFSFIVQPDTVSLIPLNIESDSLANQINRLMAPLHNATAGQLDSIEFRADVAHELYDILFKPVKDQISLSENLFIIPDMALLNLPFEMLLTNAASKNIYTPKDSADYNNYFLQNEHTFTYSPSLAPLFKKETKISKKSFIVFSNPTFYDSQLFASMAPLRSALRSIFLQLPFADEEAQRITETVKAEHIKGKEVTKDIVLTAMQKYAIVHIATHAFVDSLFDTFSGLALATTSDARDDGLLMGYELQDLSLDNDLIVLSACESGAGQFVAGEGVLGLPRLFLRAGSKSVLMSLWKVHDPFPAHLMPTFYDFYLKQNKSKAEALALAKRHVLSSRHTGDLNYKHPFFWATFCLYGSPGLAQKNNYNNFFIIGIGLLLFFCITALTFYKFRQKRF